MARAHCAKKTPLASVPVLAPPPPGFAFTKLAPSPDASDREASHASACRQLADPHRAWNTPTNQHVQRYHFVRAKLEAGPMYGTTVKFRPDGTGTRQQRGSQRGLRTLNRHSVLQVRNIA